MRQRLIKAFWACGDNEIIEFAIMRARLNRYERQVVTLLLDECLTQEQVAEEMELSTRKVQDIWYSSLEKLLSIPWVRAYANELKGED